MMLLRSQMSMSADPISRLEVVCREIDREFGDGYAASHPELVIASMNAASSDWAAARLGVAIERVAEALLVEEEAHSTSCLRVRLCASLGRARAFGMVGTLGSSRRDGSSGNY
jgi:hypothetical protein